MLLKFYGSTLIDTLQETVRAAGAEISEEGIVETFHNDDEALDAVDNGVVVRIFFPFFFGGGLMLILFPSFLLQSLLTLELFLSYTPFSILKKSCLNAVAILKITYFSECLAIYHYSLLF